MTGTDTTAATGYMVTLTAHRQGVYHRRTFATAVEAASCYLASTGINGSVSTRADELAGGAALIFERGDETIRAEREAI